jgi:hypothetical protein
MNMKKVLLIICLAVVILLAAPFLYVWACGIFMGGKRDPEKITYLTNNCRAINPSDIMIPDGFVTMPEDSVPRAFFFGEVHGFSPTRIFDAKLFMNFNQEYNVRAYCGEMFKEDASLLNEFPNARMLIKRSLRQ